MRIRLLLPVFFALLATRAAFANPLSNCVNRPGSPVTISDTLYTQFDCTFYHENVYPFDLSSYMTQGGANLSDNVLGPGYIVWTTDSGDPTNTGAWKDILFFDNNQGAGTTSSQVIVYWPTIDGGPGFPSFSTVDTFGALYLNWNPSGVQNFDPGDGNHTFAVIDNPVPEPATFGLLLSLGVGTWIFRRRLPAGMPGLDRL